MNCEKSRVLFRCIKLIEDGIDIPYALRNAASHHGININLLKEVLNDVNQNKGNFINSESWEAGVPDSKEDEFKYPEAYS